MTPPRATAPEAIGDPWMYHMRCGDFAAAWAISDQVLQSRRGEPCWHLPRHQQYIWDGTPLRDKRVLVRCYHGLGDTVQFIRFAPQLGRVAREVIVWAQPALLPLLRTAGGIDRLLPVHDGTPDAEYDVDVELMELAHVFRVTPETLPADVPYLRVPASKGGERRRGETRAGRRVNVGVVWNAGEFDRSRSIPFEYITSLGEIPHVRLHCLQRGPARLAWPPGMGMDAGSDNIEEAARSMCSLDLVITVDSFPAHLAGALGVSVWTLLPHEADWRWMSGRNDSPWYPTMRLFRQPEAGDWQSVVAAVRRELEMVILDRNRS